MTGSPSPDAGADEIPFDDAVLRGAVKSAVFGTTEALPRVGRFSVLRKIGQGGMGVVYSAYDEQLDRRVAIKMVRADLTSSETTRTRVLREARAMARLSHPNVAQVYEVGALGNQLFVAMEYVDGSSLREWLLGAKHELDEILAVYIAAG